MLLEQRLASVFVNIESMGLLNFCSWLVLLPSCLILLVDWLLEEIFVLVKTELVHGVDFVQIVYHKEQSSSLFGTWLVLLTVLIYPAHVDLWWLKLLLNINWRVFRIRQSFNELNVFEDVLVRLLESAKNLIFKFNQLLLIPCDCFYHWNSLLLKCWLLNLNNNTQTLFF